MARRKSGFVTRGGVQRREMLWTGLPPTQDSVSGGSEAVLISSLGAGILALRPFTIVRTRGVIGIRSDQIAASEDQVIAYAHAVVSDQANAIGITAVPTPVTDLGSSNFFVYESLFARFNFGDATGFDSQGMTWRTFDSKAMRKVENGQDRVAVLESGSFSAGAVIFTTHRVLIKLH